MKAIKTFVAMFLAITFAIPAYAGTLSETLAGVAAGGLVGGVGCRNCDSRTRNRVAGATAIAGGLIGYSMGDRSDRREAIDQQRYQPQYQQQPVLVASPHPQQVWVEQPQVQTQIPSAYRQMYYGKSVQRAAVEGDCDEQYYRGTYNPDAAHAYCEGRRQRERQVQDAYQAGLQGN